MTGYLCDPDGVPYNAETFAAFAAGSPYEPSAVNPPDRCYSQYLYTMPARGQITMPLAERFWSKVTKGEPGECWLWTSGKHPQGYGMFKVSRSTGNVGAHRVAFYLTNGHWPEPNCLHSCDNPPCCNPAHLREGTHAENMQDRIKRGRTNLPTGELHQNARLTGDHVAEARSLRGAGWKLVDLAARYGVNHATIARAVQGETWATAPGDIPKRIRAGEPKRGEAHPQAVTTEAAVLEIRTLAAKGVSRRELRERFSLSKTQIQRIVTGSGWPHVE